MNLSIQQPLKDLIGLFYPEICLVCESRLVFQEKYLCMECWSDLPRTKFHLKAGNKVEQLFWGRIKIEYAVACFSYKKGSNYQHLIHYIKYKGMKELGFELGRRYGFELLENNEFGQIDCIVPVPLHPAKEKQRGYNQSYWIASGIGSSILKPVVSNNLKRAIYTVTQTRKSRFERWQNVDGIFDISNADEFVGKHVLLVDDVVTTGSTLEACAFALLKIPGTKVSIATLAFADY